MSGIKIVVTSSVVVAIECGHLEGIGSNPIYSLYFLGGHLKYFIMGL
jgi:hypothetical protein